MWDPRVLDLLAERASRKVVGKVAGDRALILGPNGFQARGGAERLRGGASRKDTDLGEELKIPRDPRSGGGRSR